MMTYASFIFPLLFLAIIICLVVAFVRHRRGLSILLPLMLACLSAAALFGSYILLGGALPTGPKALSQNSIEIVYLQWDPLSEEYVKWTFDPDGQHIRYLHGNGHTLCAYTKDGNDILVNNVRLKYDALEDCYWQTYEKDGQIYKSKIVSIPDGNWDKSHLYYRYRTDNGVANVASGVPSGTPSVAEPPEISQANTAIAQGDYEAAYRLLSAIADQSEQARELLSKFAFVPLSITSTYLESHTETFTYTPDGYLASKLAAYSNYSYATYTHDSEGRLLTEHLEYDNVDGGRTTQDITYTYDDSGNLVLKIFDDDSTDYIYDANGNLIHEITMNSGGYTTEIEYAYDSNERLIRKTHIDGSFTTTEYTYSYDAAGNLISQTENSPYYQCQYTYTYDGAGNLVNMQQNNGQDTLNTNYYYDENNRLIKKEAEYTVIRDGLHSIKTRTIVYTYNSDGLLYSDTETTDSTSRTMTYHYDAFGNLSSYVNASNYMKHDTTVSYTYDLFYYPHGVPAHIREILIRKPPL
ncbi:MAG: hypothetical protein E7454_06955 [Ruminococcaceae bacterium]|nr:hypothetical protein [Oscillospiraceae bacterium]